MERITALGEDATAVRKHAPLGDARTEGRDHVPAFSFARAFVYAVFFLGMAAYLTA